MKNKFGRTPFLLISFLLHLTLIWILWPSSSETTDSSWQGQMTHIIPIHISGSKTGNTSETQFSKNKKGKKLARQQKQPQKQKQISRPGSNHQAQGSGFDSSGQASPNVLAKIRYRINRKKFMPLIAQEKNLSGNVKVSFQIAKDGKVQNLQVLQSSGHSILDTAALKTIKKAAPLPYYKNPIALVLEYQ